MKKSIFLAALALVTGMAFTGCKDDTQPRLQAPTGEFKLFEPANNNYTYDLTQNTNTITLTTSGQPDYGVATPTQYQVEVSLNDTWEPDEYAPDSEQIVKYATFYKLPTVNTQSIISMSALELNQAITVLQGVREEGQEDLYSGEARPIWVRVRAYVADPAAEDGYVPYSQVYSNSVKINSVQPKDVPSLPLPGVLYIIGDYQGWSENGNDQTATVTEEENGIGSEIYTGYVEMTAAQAKSGFRFLTQLGSWDKKFNIGAADPDMNTESVEMEDDVYNGPLVIGGQSNWGLTNYPGGWMKVTVDLNNNTVKFEYDPDYSE